ncbi:MAG: hypothetical protein LUC16_04005 [Coprobacillus sp.]|nr:hypothetical protein [Coprobacillus sp.]
MSKLDFLSLNKKSVLIICEGEEEEEYILTLTKLGVFSLGLDIHVKNARSIDNIYFTFQAMYHLDSYDIIFIFCDSEMYPFTQFNLLKENLLNFFKDNEIKLDVNEIIYYASPNTMQIVLSHFDAVRLTDSSKERNEKIIEKYTGVKEYRATGKQRKKIYSLLTRENYEIMKVNIKKLDIGRVETPSTNALKLFLMLETGDIDLPNK